MRTTGRRTLAGIAAGALAFAGLAFVAAPSAQAAGEAVVYCSDAGGDPGVAGDPTSVSTDCSVLGGPSRVANLRITNLLPAGSATWVLVNLSAGSFGTSTTVNSQFTSDNAVLNSDRNSGWFAGPGATTGAAGGTVGANYAIGDSDDTSLKLLVGSVPGTITATIATSNSPTFAGITTLNTTLRATVTITVTGTPSSMVIHPAYKVKSNTDDSAAIGLVQVFDAAGTPIAITPGDVTLGQVGTSVDDTAASPGDCTTNSAGLGVFSASAQAGLNDGALASPTEACTALEETGTGVWLRSLRTQSAGSYTVQVVVSVGGATYTDSITYQVSSYIASAVTAQFDKPVYTPGENASLTWCATTLAGTPVADGLGWFNGGTDDTLVRNVAVTSNFATPAFTNVTSLSTYNGCATVRAPFAPSVPLEWRVSTTALGPTLTVETDGWTAAALGTTVLADSRVGSPEPTTPTIMIVGERGTGDNLNMVFVEGGTTNMVGKTVTPHFRFPGQTGFTAGTGTRTVDAEGNFNWQRKTGKQIAVQFRGEGVSSNTVIIAAK